MSSCDTRPTMRSRSGSRISPPSTIDGIYVTAIMEGGEILEPLRDRIVDDHVLGHVDQTPGQVARVRRLERRVGQALTGAVGRDEVLEDRQALAEVGRDRKS